MIIQKHGLAEGQRLQTLVLAACHSGRAAGCCLEDAGSNPHQRGIRGGDAAPVGRQYR